jgi:hypothetical protein
VDVPAISGMRYSHAVDRTPTTPAT